MIALVDTGVANCASLETAFARLGAGLTRTCDPAEVEAADAVVLPGVGHFQAAMESLASRGVDRVLRGLVEAGRPFLGICLGMQLLGEGSDEAPGVPGLGLVASRPRALETSGPRPRFGWMTIEPTAACEVLQRDAMYFANSYAFPTIPRGWNGATAGGAVAALQRGRQLLCQFHPELSGPAGADLLSRWLQCARGRNADGVNNQTSRDAFENTIAPATDGTARRILPCLDVRDGRVVKGVQFQSLRDCGCPAERAAIYAQDGADEIVVLDVAATTTGRSTAVETIRRVRLAVDIPVTAGGGVTTVTEAAALLHAGADKVAVNTAAVRCPHLVDDLARLFGTQCIVVAIDAKQIDGRLRVTTRSGSRVEPIDATKWASEVADRGAGEVLLTSWDRDGTGAGYDLDALRAVTDAIDVPVIASGGARSADDLSRAFGAGASAALAASIFHDDDTTVAQVKRRLRELGHPMHLGQPRRIPTTTATATGDAL